MTEDANLKPGWLARDTAAAAKRIEERESKRPLSPKVKPLVAFAAVRDGVIAMPTIARTEDGCRDSFGWSNNDWTGFPQHMTPQEGWKCAEGLGWRIIKVRIEPVEE